MVSHSAGWGDTCSSSDGRATDALDNSVHDCFKSTFKNLLHRFVRSLSGCVEPKPYFWRCFKQVIQLLNAYLALSVSNLSHGRSSSLVTLSDHRHGRTKDDEIPWPNSRPAQPRSYVFTIEIVLDDRRKSGVAILIGG